MSHASVLDTIVAVATAQGRAAVGVVRLSGPDALKIGNVLFTKKDLKQVKSHTVHFGPLTDMHGSLLDEVLVTVMKGPRSYTGQDTVEFSCHGSPYVLQSVVEACMAAGARLAQPGEFTQRAFLNGKLDLVQAEAVADVIAAESARQAQVALRQMRSGFTHTLSGLRQTLVDFAALIELELDFGEEDVEFANRQTLTETLQQTLTVVEQLRDSFKWGNVLKQGVKTVIAGRPNAGKSTLLNALLNEERAIVSPVAGTTRDTIEEVLYIEGLAFRLVDTAGLRYTTDIVEATGIQRMREQVRHADLLIYLYDATTATAEDVAEDLKTLWHPGLNIILVGNKYDLLTDENSTTLYMPVAQEPAIAAHIAISAHRKQDVERIKQQLIDLYREALDHAGDALLVTNMRHHEALAELAAGLRRALAGLSDRIASDLVAMDIRQALFHLGLITGEVSSDELLGRIFSRFCIGK